MDIDLVVVDADTKEMYDVSELVKQIDWTTSLDGSAGQLSFSLATSDYNFSPGSDVAFRISNKANVFLGKVFKTAYNKDKELEVIAYDQTRYLTNKDTYIFKGKKAYEIFEKICKDWGFNYRIADEAKVNYICVPFPHDDKPLSEIIQRALDDTLIFNQQYLFVRDVWGVLTLDNLINYRRNYILDTDFLTENFSYSRSIESDVYNAIKLERFDQQKQQKVITYAEDKDTIGKWGKLQYFQKAEDNASDAELKMRAGYLLSIKNRPREKLSFTCEGRLDLFAGCGIRINLSDYVVGKSAKFCIIQTARHTFTNNEHKMDLEVIL